MATSFQPGTDPASAESLIRYAVPLDVFAALVTGGSISIEEYPQGAIVAAAREADSRDRGHDDAALVISLVKDAVGGDPISTVWFHPDQDDRIEVLNRAREALDAAIAALEAVGYVDKAHLGDYHTVPQRERNAYEIGRDVGRE